MKRFSWRWIAYWALMGLFMAISVLLLFDNLGVPRIAWADESRHGINAYEMMQRGDWVVHTYRGETDYWNLKPTLSYYGIMLGYKLFGYTAFGLRFYSALSMLATMGILALWTKRRFGSIVSLVSQLFLMGCATIYGPHFARFGDADAQFVLLYTLCMLCMLESERDIRWLYGSAIGFGLAFLSKSWHAALIPVTCLLFVCLNGDIKKLRPRQYMFLVFFGLLPILPWAIARFRFDGFTFFKSMFTTDVVTRATTTHEMHEGGWTYYLECLITDPAAALAIVGGIGSLVWKALCKSRLTREQLGLMVWAATPVVLYSLCVSKLAWYIFPVLPALGVGLGLVCQRLLRGHKRPALRLACVIASVCLLVSGTAVNLKTISSVKRYSYDKLFNSLFLRERDYGVHVYIQYESENPYSVVDHRAWMQGELLSAELAGGLICIDGGTAAFVEDPEPAYLIAHDIGLETDLLAGYDQIFHLDALNVYKNKHFGQ